MTVSKKNIIDMIKVDFMEEQLYWIAFDCTHFLTSVYPAFCSHRCLLDEAFEG